MAKASTARALNTLTWEERYPSRYDTPLADLSKWQAVVEKLANESKKGSAPASSAKTSKK